MYSVYVLRSLKDKRTHVGCTHDIKNRIKEHNLGEVKSTKARTPFVLWYKEDYKDKFEAFKREQHFKTSWGRRQLRKILDNYKIVLAWKVAIPVMGIEPIQVLCLDIIFNN